MVVDHNNHVKGIITRKDLMGFAIEEKLERLLTNPPRKLSRSVVLALRKNYGHKHSQRMQKESASKMERGEGHNSTIGSGGSCSAGGSVGGKGAASNDTNGNTRRSSDLQKMQDPERQTLIANSSSPTSRKESTRRKNAEKMVNMSVKTSTSTFSQNKKDKDNQFSANHLV